jgi:hypothetical protein
MILNRQGEAEYSRMFSEHPRRRTGATTVRCTPGRNKNAKKGDIDGRG